MLSFKQYPAGQHYETFWVAISEFGDFYRITEHDAFYSTRVVAANGSGIASLMSVERRDIARGKDVPDAFAQAVAQANEHCAELHGGRK